MGWQEADSAQWVQEAVTNKGGATPRHVRPLLCLGLDFSFAISYHQKSCINLRIQFVPFCLSVNCVLVWGVWGRPGGTGGAKRLGAPVVLRAQLFGGRAELTPSPFMCEGLIRKAPPKRAPNVFAFCGHSGSSLRARKFVFSRPPSAENLGKT